MLITCPKCSAKYQIPAEIKLTAGKKMQCSACQHIFEFHPAQEKTGGSNPALLPPADAVLSFDTKVERIVVKKTESQGPSSLTGPVLPEVFRPLQSGPVSKHLPCFWCLVSLLLLVGLLMMGWLWRDLLLMKTPVFPSTHTSVPVRIHHRPAVRPVSHVEQDIPLFVEEEVTQPQEIVSEPVVKSHPTVQSVRFRKTPTGDALLIEGALKNTTSETIPVPEKIYALAYDTEGALAFEKEIYLPEGVLYPDMAQPFFGTYAPVTKEIQWVDVVLEK